MSTISGSPLRAAGSAHCRRSASEARSRVRQVEEGDRAGEQDEAERHRPGELLDQRERRIIVGRADDRREGDPEQAFADDQAGRHQHAEPLGEGRVGRALGPLVVEIADRRADRDEQGQRHRQIDAHADRERRKRALAGLAQDFVDDDHADADRAAEPDQAPVEAAAEHALRDRRDQRRLRRGERVGPGPRRALEAEGVVEDGQDRRDDERCRRSRR